MKRAVYYLWLWLPPLAWCGVIFFFSSLPGLESGLERWLDILLRKTAHMVEFGILACLIFCAIINSMKIEPFRAYSWSGFLSIIYAITDEFHQSFVPARSPGITDVLIDSAGVLFALFIIWKAYGKKNEPLKNIRKTP